MATAAPETRAVRTVANTDVPATIATHAGTQAIIAPLLPKGVTFEQVAAQVRLALAKDTRGDLKKCTVGSVILAVAKICGWGLEVGVTAHLVPMGDQCQAWRDYTGDIQLAIESGMVKRVSAFVVYQNEPLRIRRGSHTEIEHEPIQDPKQRGPMVGVYANLFLRGGDFETEYLTVEEVDAIRQAHSKQWKAGPVPRWYMKKTAIRQALKLIPKTPKLRELLATMEEAPIDAEAIDAELAEAPSLAPGDVSTFRLSSGPRPLAQPADGAYGLTPVAPGSVNDHAEADRGEQAPLEYQDDSALDDSGELALGVERTAPTRRNADALREG